MENIFAAGDAACAPLDGGHFSVMSCQHARPMGRFAGHNAVCDLLGRPMLPLRIDWYVTCLDLGAWGARVHRRLGSPRRRHRNKAQRKPSGSSIASASIRHDHEIGSKSSTLPPRSSRDRRHGLANPGKRAEAMPEDEPQRRYTANLQGEVDSAALYRTLAQTEKNPQLAQVYRRLAAIEEAHAEYWKNHIAAIDQRVPKLRPGFRTRALGLARAPLRPGLRAADRRHARAYGQRHLRRAAGGRRRRVAGRRALACPHHRGAGCRHAGRAQRLDAGAPGGPASRDGRQRAARRRARRQ